MMIDEVSHQYEGSLSPEFVDFARRQLVNATSYANLEKRVEDRHPMMLPALLVELNENDEPIGEVIEAVTRDVASTSIGLFHEEALPSKRYAIHFFIANAEVNLVLQIIWRSEMGPFYGSAGWYVKRLDRFPAAPANV
jgi:hypothetical protein